MNVKKKITVYATYAALVISLVNLALIVVKW